MDMENHYDADDERDWDECPENSNSSGNIVSQQEQHHNSETGDSQKVNEIKYNVENRDNPGTGDHTSDNLSSTSKAPNNETSVLQEIIKPLAHEPLRRSGRRRRGGGSRQALRPVSRKFQGLQGDRFGVTPLHIAVERRSVDLVKLLVRAGADVDAQDHTGRSPLHLACEMERMDLVQALLRMRMQPMAYSSGRRITLRHIQHGRISRIGNSRKHRYGRRLGRRRSSESSISSFSSDSSR